MSAESNARTHAEQFRWWRGHPDFTDEEARLQDLLALHRATTELVEDQRELVRLYAADVDEELFDDL